MFISYLPKQIDVK